VRELHCATCQAEMPFEALPADDEGADEFPELLCTGCGTAVVVAPFTLRVWLRGRGTAIAPQQRRAA
jgi:heterodisulfide reductase subunit A-like polyferredoxin